MSSVRSTGGARGTDVGRRGHLPRVLARQQPAGDRSASRRLRRSREHSLRRSPSIRAGRLRVVLHAESLAWPPAQPQRGSVPVHAGGHHRHALRFNRRWQRSAHLFENRFGCVLQESEEQFLWTTRYIVRNPVEANIVASPVDTEWSSYRATVGRAQVPPFLRVEAVLSPFGGSRVDAVRRFEAFVLGDSAAHHSGLPRLSPVARAA